VAFLLASVLGVCTGAFCDDEAFVATPAQWDDATCQKGTALKRVPFTHGVKVRWCLPKGVTDSAIEYEMKEFATGDCKETKCLQKVSAKCGYTYSDDKGFDIKQLHGAECPTATDDCRAAITAGLAGAFDGETCGDAETKQYLEWFNPKCAGKKAVVSTTCKTSEFGCCLDGVTAAKGPFNKGCCNYETELLGGVCAKFNPTTGRGYCGEVDGVDECTATTPQAGGTSKSNNARQASMVTNAATGQPFTCYCDSVCDITKDCCDGITSIYCQAITGKILQEAPKIPQ